jgi:hypothetical protein
MVTVVEATTAVPPPRPATAPVAGTSAAAHHATTPAASGKPPVAGPVVGSTIGLEPSGHPGQRVRHRDFVGRVDDLGPDSSGPDRADSRFVIRAGLAQSGCFSFESADYPGYYLRHQNFVIHLERRDGSGLFAADATFCPVGHGGGFSLRSVNYPALSITDQASQLKLTSVATTFVIRPPL